MSLSFTIAAGSRQHSHSQIRVPRDSWPYFTVSDSRLPKLEGQVHVLITLRDKVAQLYPQALGSLFVTSYDLLGYGGGIWPPIPKLAWDPCYIASARRTQQKTPSHLLSQQYLNCCLLIDCLGTVFTKLLPCSEHLLWLHYSGFRASCHNKPLYVWLSLCKT
jgi:hypothetical protein